MVAILPSRYRMHTQVHRGMMGTESILARLSKTVVYDQRPAQRLADYEFKLKRLLEFCVGRDLALSACNSTSPFYKFPSWMLMFKQSGAMLCILLALCVVLPPVLGFNGPNFAAARAGRSLTMRGAPPVVILPGFGNAQEDYIDPYNGQLGDEASFVSSLRKRGLS